MSADLLERMRALDPARDTDLAPREDLLAQLLADMPQPRRRRRLALALPAGALAAAAAGAIAVTGGPAPDVAAQAYAQTGEAGKILYVRTRSDSEGGATNSESWLYRDRGRSHTDFGKGEWSDMQLRSDGSVRFRNGFGQDVVTTDADGPDAQSWHAGLQQNFISEFRRNYEQGTLDPSGTVEYAGRRAQRYTVDRRTKAPAMPKLNLPAGTATEHQEFFVDAEDGTPLGSVRESTTTIPGRPVQRFRWVQRVEAIEHLDPTPENLAKLSS